QK
ncbi:hypothetical protein D030_1449B, partial [Vibrio parahaemolyticus AQ3810]